MLTLRRFLLSDRWYVALVGYETGLLVWNSWTRAWGVVTLAVVAIAAILLMMKARAILELRHAIYDEELRKVKADAAVAERMAEEIDRAIKDGRVHFAGEHLESERPH